MSPYHSIFVTLAVLCVVIAGVLANPLHINHLEEETTVITTITKTKTKTVLDFTSNDENFVDADQIHSTVEQVAATPPVVVAYLTEWNIFNYNYNNFPVVRIIITTHPLFHSPTVTPA